MKQDVTPTCERLGELADWLDGGQPLPPATGRRWANFARAVADLLRAQHGLIDGQGEELRLRRGLARLDKALAERAPRTVPVDRLLDYVSECQRLRADNARLRAALTPFAAFWQGHPYQASPHWPLDCTRSAGPLPTLGDCRRAAEALAPVPEGE